MRIFTVIGALQLLTLSACDKKEPTRDTNTVPPSSAAVQAASEKGPLPTTNGPTTKEFAKTPDLELGTLPDGIGVAVGEPAPNAKVEDADGQAVELSSLFENGSVLLVFYRGGWCPYCSFQIHELAKALPEYEKRSVTPVAISVDRPEEASKSKATYEIAFPVLSDPHLTAHRAYRVVHEADDAEVARLKGLGIDLERSSGQDHHSFAVPALFLIDAAGQVQWAHANADYKVRPRTEQILTVIDRVHAKAP